MPSSRDAGASPRRILVIANETCAGQGVVDEVRYRGGPDAAVLVVAPALARGRLEHWLTADIERRREEALERLDGSVAALAAAGLDARGHLGDADPLQALDDALRTFEPDEIVISTHPHHRSNWLERQVVSRARSRYALPITHVVVDLEHERTVTAAAPATAAPPGADLLRLFHSSDYDEALRIRDEGFRDSAEAGGSGVPVSDRPPRGGADRIVFAVDVPAEAALRFAGEPGPEGERRFLVPADLLNRHGPPVAEGEWSE